MIPCNLQYDFLPSHVCREGQSEWKVFVYQSEGASADFTISYQNDSATLKGEHTMQQKNAGGGIEAVEIRALDDFGDLPYVGGRLYGIADGLSATSYQYRISVDGGR